MLSNTIILNDGVGDNTYDLVSRSGMSSVRREVGSASSEASALTIKNTIDLNAPETKNRHLVQISWNEIGSEGQVYPASVHVVVSRHKMVSDAEIKSRCAEMAAFIGSSTNLTDILVGGN